METKEGTMKLPVDEPNGKDSGEELATEVDEEALETKFPAKERVVEPEDVEWLSKATKIWDNELPKACEKAWVRSCSEGVKEGAVVTGTAGVNEFVPDEGRAEDEGWSESNVAATVLFVERSGIWKNRGKKVEKQPSDSLQGVPTLREMLTPISCWLRNANKTATKPYEPRTRGNLACAHN